MFLSKDQREIQRKLRILRYADKIGHVAKTCRYFGIGRSSFYRWRVIAVMSVIFSEAEEVGKMRSNPALGVKRKFKPAKNANRCWTDHEWQTVYSLAPKHTKLVLEIIRWAGLRGEDVQVLTRSAYRPDPEMGMVLAFNALKNGEWVEIGAVSALRKALDAQTRDMLPGCPRLPE